MSQLVDDVQYGDASLQGNARLLRFHEAESGIRETTGFEP